MSMILHVDANENNVLFLLPHETATLLYPYSEDCAHMLILDRPFACRVPWLDLGVVEAMTAQYVHARPVCCRCETIQHRSSVHDWQLLCLTRWLFRTCSISLPLLFLTDSVPTCGCSRAVCTCPDESSSLRRRYEKNSIT